MPYKDMQTQREYQRLWMKKRREDFFNGKCCVQCGSIESLELDHIDPKLKISHNIWSWAEQRRQEEIAKCQVLCKSCHQKKTSLMRPAKHATDNMYGKYKCRCDDCRRARSIAKASNRARRKSLGLPYQ